MTTGKQEGRVTRSEAVGTATGTVQGGTPKGGPAVVRRKRTKCVTFWVTEDQKAEMSSYAIRHNMSLSRLIQEGLEMRMAK